MLNAERIRDEARELAEENRQLRFLLRVALEQLHIRDEMDRRRELGLSEIGACDGAVT